PFGMMLVLAVVFSLIGGPTDGMPFFIFLYCGLLPWTFFAGTVSIGSLSLVANSNLISKVYFPRVLLPAATVGAGLVDLGIASVILVALAFYYRMPATWNLLMLPVLVVITMLLTLGVVVWLSAVTVKYRDIRHVIPFALQVGFFGTPIIYPASLVPEKWRWLLFLNPMTGIVEGVRSALSGRPFDWPSVGFSAAVTLVLLVLAIAAFHRTEKSFADLI
ncbi:MAG TPA: ABC transporter permease, partial [Pyrinomonadaceae bacterium]